MPSRAFLAPGLCASFVLVQSQCSKADKGGSFCLLLPSLPVCERDAVSPSQISGLQGASHLFSPRTEKEEIEGNLTSGRRSSSSCERALAKKEIPADFLVYLAT